MKSIQIARGEKGRDGLVGFIGIAPRVGPAFAEYFGRHAHRFVMQQPVEHRAAPGNRRLHQDRAAAWSQHALRLAKERRWKLQMMQHVDHDNVCGARRGERQLLRVGDGVEPGRELDVSRDHVAEAVLKIADAAADLDRCARHTGRGNAIVEVVVNGAQNRFARPYCAIVLQRIGAAFFADHGALIRRNANHSMRSNNSPWLNREI